MKDTPKVSTQRPRLRSGGASAGTLPKAQAEAPAEASCGAVVASAFSFQVARKPVSPTVRSSGRKRPANDGCGQSDASSTRVDSPTGAKARSPVPTSSIAICTESALDEPAWASSRAT